MTPDSELLRRFAKTDSEDAFAELVKRHVNLVYSAALRQVGGDAHLAQDVAQSVFADLARKAGALSDRQNLTGWLYTSAHFAAAKIARTENRRRDREEKFMRESTHETAPDASRAEAFAEAGADWEQIHPALDDAMHELNEIDREAILFRFFENQPFVQVGAKLGLNENAARMRVERALEKLRAIFAKRGITTAAALASVISANAVQVAPANLVATLTSASVTAAGTGTFTLLKIMTMAKFKLGISALVVAGAATALVVQHQNQTQLRDENASLQQQIAQLKADNQSLSNRLAAVGQTKTLTDDQFNELLRLRGEIGLLRQQTNELGRLREENRQLDAEITAGQRQSIQSPAEAQYEWYHTNTIHTMMWLGLDMKVYAGEHNDKYATNFNQLEEVDHSIPNFPIGTNDVEFVNAGLESQQNPRMITFRERIPRRTPSGKWERIYGMADGSVSAQTSDDGNFAGYEQKHSPPPNQ